MRRFPLLLLLALGCGSERLVSVPDVVHEEAPAPPCAAPHPCRVSSLDRVAGRCVERDAPDGTRCDGGACLTEGRCLSGECVGLSVDCDDRNPCTLDVCDPDLGCVDLGPASACPVPENPCMASTCDPASGCGEEPVQDGRLCHSGDDRAAGTCSGGSCVPAVPLDACSSACWAGCWPGSETAPLWTYRPALPGTVLRFGAIADGAGNLYWRERGPGGCFFVSMSIAGSERFRAASPCELDEHMALFRKGLVVLLGRDEVVALDTTDGHVAWTAPPRAPATCDRAGAAMAASDDTLFIVWNQVCDDSRGVHFLKSHALSGVLLATGQLRFDYSAGGGFSQIDARIPTVVCDGDGNAYARFADGRYRSNLVSLAADGTLRWQSTEALRWPVAAWADRVFLFWYSGLLDWGGAVRRGSDGAPLFGIGDAIEGRGIESAFIHFGAGFTIDRIGRVWSTTGRNLALRDSGGIVWSRSGCSLGVCLPSSSPMLTESGTLLLTSTGMQPKDLSLAEVDDAGTVRRTCTLQSSARAEGPFVLHDGRFVAPLVDETRQVVGVAAWWLPGLTEASSGWTSPGGGPARGGAPH